MTDYKNLILLSISITISLLTSELLVRVFKPQLTFINAETLSFDCFAKDPILPFSLQKNHKCRMKYYLGDFDTYATLNSQGYRGKEFNIEKDQGKTRILILGDSITFGHGVADEETFPYQLETILKTYGDVEVINAGYASGFTTDTYYLYLKERGLKLKPDIVILSLFVMNDISDLNETIWEKIDENGLPMKIVSCCRTVDWKILRNKNFLFKYSLPILRDSHLFILLIDTLGQRAQIHFDPPAILLVGDIRGTLVLDPKKIHLFHPEEQKTYLLISEIKKLTDSQKLKFLVLLFPGDLQLYPSATSKYGLDVTLPSEDNRNFIQKRLADFFQKNNIVYLDLYPIFEQGKNRGYPYFMNDAHFNRLGNQISAEAIAQFLKQQNWLLP